MAQSTPQLHRQNGLQKVWIRDEKTALRCNAGTLPFVVVDAEEANLRQPKSRKKSALKKIRVEEKCE